MLPKTLSFTILGIEAFLVKVKADFTPGLPEVIIIKESRKRIKSALKNSGFSSQ